MVFSIHIVNSSSFAHGQVLLVFSEALSPYPCQQHSIGSASIFLPAGGYREGEARNNRETAGWYWTKTRERGKYGDMRYFSLFFFRKQYHDV